MEGRVTHHFNHVHGEAHAGPNGQPTPEYRAWVNMRRRCRPDHEQARSYFERGITVCERWEHSFEAFLEDMGRRPSRDHSLDRVDNDRGYEPGNVRWATDAQQTHNTSRNRACDLSAVLIRQLAARGHSVERLAEAFDLKYELVRRIVKRDRWRDAMGVLAQGGYEP
jgi:hypothetical protein